MPGILIVESDVAAAKALQELLKSYHVSSQVIYDGSLAYSAVQEYEPDVIVLCVELQKISGYSICNKIRKDPTLQTIPLILTSSQATPETFEQHKKLRTKADVYLHKPYSNDDILHAIHIFYELSEWKQQLSDHEQSETPHVETFEEPLPDLAVALPSHFETLPEESTQSDEVQTTHDIPLDPATQEDLVLQPVTTNLVVEMPAFVPELPSIPEPELQPQTQHNHVAVSHLPDLAPIQGQIDQLTQQLQQLVQQNSDFAAAIAATGALQKNLEQLEQRFSALEQQQHAVIKKLEENEARQTKARQALDIAEELLGRVVT